MEIRWPASGETQTLRGLAMDQAYHIREGDTVATPEPLKPTPFDLTRHVSHGHMTRK